MTLRLNRLFTVTSGDIGYKQVETNSSVWRMQDVTFYMMISTV